MFLKPYNVIHEVTQVHCLFVVFYIHIYIYIYLITHLVFSIVKTTWFLLLLNKLHFCGLKKGTVSTTETLNEWCSQQ